MTGESLVAELSRLLPRACSSGSSLDMWASFSVAVGVVLGLACYGIAFRSERPPGYERVEGEQGGLLFGKGFMPAGYWMLQPLGCWLCRLGARPSGITLVGLLCALAGAIAIGSAKLGVAGMILLGAALCDALDGMVARLGARSSQSGAALDALADRLQEILAFSGIAWLCREVPWMSALAAGTLVASLVNSYISARADIGSAKIPSGRMRRGERSAWVILGCTLAPLMPPAGPMTHAQVAALPLLVSLLVIGVGTATSAVARSLALLRVLRDREVCEAKASTEITAADSLIASRAARGIVALPSRRLEQIIHLRYANATLI